MRMCVYPYAYGRIVCVCAVNVYLSGTVAGETAGWLFNIFNFSITKTMFVNKYLCYYIPSILILEFSILFSG